MHVCWYWRDTLVSARLLWYIGDLPAPLPTVNLNRSGSASIWLNIDKGDHDRFVAVVSPYQEEHNALWLDLVCCKLVSVSRLTLGSVSHLRVLTLKVDFSGRAPMVSTHLLQELTSCSRPSAHLCGPDEPNQGARILVPISLLE